VSIPTIALGVTIFTIGLAKKVLLADTAALYASPLFDAVAAGARPDALAAWGSALAYTALLYFDFSGYSDMAIFQMLLAMAGRNGAARPESVDSAAALVVSIALLAIAWFAPNTLTGYEGPEGTYAATEARRPALLRWRPSAGWAVACPARYRHDSDGCSGIGVPRKPSWRSPMLSYARRTMSSRITWSIESWVPTTMIGSTANGSRVVRSTSLSARATV
jgi:hypothetical protein